MGVRVQWCDGSLRQRAEHGEQACAVAVRSQPWGAVATARLVVTVEVPRQAQRVPFRPARSLPRKRQLAFVDTLD